MACIALQPDAHGRQRKCDDVGRSEAIASRLQAPAEGAAVGKMDVKQPCMLLIDMSPVAGDGCLP
jgi:hypothetical protein